MYLHNQLKRVKFLTSNSISALDLSWFQIEYESMVSFVSRRYMRGENEKDSLMVCLSQIVIFVFQNNVIKAYWSVLLIRIVRMVPFIKETYFNSYLHIFKYSYLN